PTRRSSDLQQNRSLVADFELTWLGVGRAGKCSSLVTEQFALQQVARNGGTVDFEKRAVRALRQFMNQSCQHFLTRAALTQQQDRDINIGDQRSLGTDLPHGGASGAEEHVIAQLLPFPCIGLLRGT